MNIFVAGGTGAIGRSLIPMLVSEGHRVVAMTRSTDRVASLEAMGAEAAIGDVFKPVELEQLIVSAQPDIVIHQLTAFGTTKGDPLAATIRIRTEGTRNLIAAARAANARRFIAQSISFICTPVEEGLTNENTPLYLDASDAIRPLAESVAALEKQTLSVDGMQGIVLRYGWFYGPGTNYDMTDTIPRAIRKGKMPIEGEGAGTYSFIHVDDAAAATAIALSKGEPGIYNIVDDDPAPLNTWLPEFAKLLDSPTPPQLDVPTAKKSLGEMLVYIMNEQRGASNTKAKHDLNWQPTIQSWREGFAKEIAKHSAEPQ